MEHRAKNAPPTHFDRLTLSKVKNLANFKNAVSAAILPDEIHKNKMVIIQAQSSGFNSGNEANITIHDVPVELANNENNHDRGLHLVVINPTNGMVETAQVFDTNDTSNRFNEFVSNDISEGNIVIAACKDECS